MARSKSGGRRRSAAAESDSSYIVKVALYLVLGTIWISIVPSERLQIPLPVGAFAGLYFASKERFEIDKKFEYAILVIAMFAGFWLPNLTISI